MKAALSQLSTGVTAEDFISNINSLRDTGNIEIAQQEIRGVISKWEQEHLSKQLIEFLLNEFVDLLHEREDLEAILLSVVSKYKPVFKKTNLQADAEFFKRLQKISKEKGTGENQKFSHELFFEAVVVFGGKLSENDIFGQLTTKQTEISVI